MGRTVLKSIRFSEEEIHYLSERARAYREEHRKEGKKGGAAGQEGRAGERDNLSAYIRQLLFSQSGYKDEETVKLLRDLKYELRKIGTNVNQVARKINGGYVGSSADLMELKGSLARIEEAFAKMRKEVEEPWQSRS